MNVLRPIVFALMLVICSGCATTPLEQFVIKNKFTPFYPPRDHDGEGSVIAFAQGQEFTVQSADPQSGKCFLAPAVSHAQGNVFLTTTSYEIDSRASLEFDLAKVLGKDVQVKGGFDDTRVKKVSIELIQPFARRITLGEATTYIEGLKQDDTCRTAAVDKHNYVIHTVLGAKGLHYSFLDQNDKALKLDATLLNRLHLAPEISSKFVGKDTLDVNVPILIGYRAWRGVILPPRGVSSGTVEVSHPAPAAAKIKLEEVKPSELAHAHKEPNVRGSG